MEIHLKVVGVLLIVLGLAHVFFPKYFRWREDLEGLSLINRQMMNVHTFFIALTVILMGLLSLFFARSLTSTQLGQIVSVGLAIFWGARLVVQFFGYSSKLWKGKPFETIVHVVFSVLWLYLTTVFCLVAIG